jgi:hypothetical protein
MARLLKLLVRSWVSGKGCVYQRSTSLPETEALELLEAARGSIDKAQESGTIEEIPLPKGRAFVQARRSPDPDQPNRTAPGFVLVSIPDPDAFLRDVIAHEFDILIRSAAHKTLDDIPLPTEGDPGKRDWKLMDLGKPPTSSPGKHQMRRKQIQKVLDESWIKNHVVNNSPGDGINRDLIRQFAGLFQRPDLKLDANEFRKYNALSPSEDPFVAFLSRLLEIEKIPSLPSADTDLTPSEALQYLRDLEMELKKRMPYGIELDLVHPETLADRTRTSLDYPEFCKSWRKTTRLDSSAHERWKNDPWGQSREGDAAYLWVKPIRLLIESRYSREIRRQ